MPHEFESFRALCVPEYQPHLPPDEPESENVGTSAQVPHDAGCKFDPPRWEPTILHEAIDKTTGSRNRQYGDPDVNHGCTAAMFSAYLSRRFNVAIQLTAEDVCALNIMQKVSRLANDPTHLDSWVDVAGFAGNAGTCIELRGE